jgi:hypothetical protein
MTERRLPIAPEDIQHVEIRCSECEAGNLVPVRDPDLIAKFKRADLPGEFNILTQCFSCVRAFNPPIHRELRAFINGLTELRAHARSGSSAVRLVAREVQPTSTGGL